MLRMNVDNYCPTVDEVISNLVDGFKVIFPGPDELFLDIDSEEAYGRYRNMYSLLSSLLRPHDGLRSFETVSKSGLPNRHIRITLPGDMTMEQRFIFQLALGSDPARELMNYASYLNGEQSPSIFIEPVEDVGFFAIDPSTIQPADDLRRQMLAEIREKVVGIKSKSIAYGLVLKILNEMEAKL